MVLIFSESSDLSTHQVIDWIHYFKYDFIVIYPETEVELQSIELTKKNGIDFQLSIANKTQIKRTINYRDINSVWFRRGYLKFDNIIIKSGPSTYKTDEKNVSKELTAHLYNEKRSVKEFLQNALELKRSLGSFSRFSINKLTVLCYAREIGLLIPDTYLVMQKAKLLEVLDKTPKAVCKSIQDLFYILINGQFFNNYTERIASTDVDFIADNQEFFATQIQEEIDKKFEVRTFYLNGDCFSMAIFSQKDDQTEVDFRKYNSKWPNRMTPFILPTSVEFKIRMLMERLKLKTGSLDLIVSKSDKYIFLEVNPIGQFGMVSAPCNYQLEKKIAQYLTGA